MMHRLLCSIRIPLPIEEVFHFFGDAANLERITPPELHFRIVTPQPISMAEGTLIDYRLRLFGAPMLWKTRISLWEPPHRFVDEQLSGPYKIWVHTHRFSSAIGSTLMEDEVVYELPFRPLGEVVYPLVRLELNRIFGFRQRTIWKILVEESSAA
jgi:ligand-binding SRPBCC domain-containing protein